MKRFVRLLRVGILLVPVVMLGGVLSGCGGNKQSEEDQKKSVKELDKEQQDTVKKEQETK